MRSSRSDGTTNRREAQREATRGRLFDESVREFRRCGVAQTEIAVIAERVGVSRGTFYVHFADKDDVLRELLLAEEQRIADAVRPIVERDDSIEGVLRAIADAVLRSERRLGRKLIRDLCAAQFRPEFAQDHAVSDHPVGLLLVEALADRHVDADPAELAAVFLTGLFGLLATGDGPQELRRRHLDLLVTIVAKGATT